MVKVSSFKIVKAFIGLASGIIRDIQHRSKYSHCAQQNQNPFECTHLAANAFGSDIVPGPGLLTTTRQNLVSASLLKTDEIDRQDLQNMWSQD